MRGGCKVAFAVTISYYFWQVMAMSAKNAQKRRGTPQGFYRVMLVAFILVIVLVIVLTSLGSYAICQDVVKDQMYRSDMQILKDSKRNMETMYEQAVSLSGQIFQDWNTTYFLYGQSFDPYLLRAGIVQLDNYRLTIPNLESIYVYNGKTRELTVDSTKYTRTNIQIFEPDCDFYDQEIIALIHDIDGYNRKYPIARRIPSPTDSTEKTDVYTFFFLQGLSNEESTSMVFVNFSSDFLYNAQEGPERTVILDGEGKTVLDGVSGIGADLSVAAYCRTARESASSQGSFVDVVDDVQMLVTFMKDAETGWIYMRLSPYSEVKNTLNQILQLTVAVISLMIVFGALVSWRISRRLYVPVKHIADSLRDEQDKNRRVQYLQAQHRLWSWLTGSELSDREKNALGIVGNSNETYRLLCIQIDGFQKLLSTTKADDRELLRYGMMNMAEELYSDRGVAKAVTQGDGREIFLILSGQKNDMQVHEISKRVQTEILRHLGQSVSVLIGPPFLGVKQMASAFHFLQQCTFLTLFTDPGSIVFTETASAGWARSYDYPIALQESMCSEVLKGNEEKAKEWLEQIILETKGYSYAVLNLVVSRLTLAFSELVQMIRKNQPFSDDAILEKVEYAFYAKDAERVGEIVGHFAKIIEEICTYLSDRKNSRHSDLVRSVDALIAGNYQENDFCLDVIANRLGLTGAYLGRIYKQHTGYGVAEMIAAARMHRAKELLCDEKKWPISEIAKMCGYTSGAYFSRIFKKENGVTPNEYRQSMVKGK